MLFQSGFCQDRSAVTGEHLLCAGLLGQRPGASISNLPAGGGIGFPRWTFGVRIHPSQLLQRMRMAEARGGCHLSPQLPAVVALCHGSDNRSHKHIARCRLLPLALNYDWGEGSSCLVSPRQINNGNNAGRPCWSSRLASVLLIEWGPERQGRLAALDSKRELCLPRKCLGFGRRCLWARNIYHPVLALLPLGYWESKKE